MTLLALALAAPLARAATTASTFAEDAGGWSGGAVAGGVLTVADGAITLAPGAMAQFRLAARVRLTTGTRLSFAAGGATLAATYGEGGALALGADTNDGEATNPATAPLPPFEHTWLPDVAPAFDGAAPDVVRFGGTWRLYREVDGVIVAATSDGLVWTELGAVLTGTAPDAVDEGGTLALYYGCDGGICRARSSDGVAFTAEGVVLDAPGPASVAAAGDGWRMWYAVATGTASATSADGHTWTVEGAVADATRLVDADVVAAPSATTAVWTGTDGIYTTVAAPADAASPGSALADPTADRGPLFPVGAVSWCPDAPTAPALALDGTTWHLWVTCAQDGSRVGHLRGVPAPGGWVGLVAEWDGATLTTSWSGTTLTTPLAAADALTFASDGTLELDEAQLTYTLASEADTGAPTEDTGDTGVERIVVTDTAEVTVVTALTDTDTAADADTGAANAAELTGERGGWGCYTAPATPRIGAWILAMILLFRRKT